MSQVSKNLTQSVVLIRLNERVNNEWMGKNVRSNYEVNEENTREKPKTLRLDKIVEQIVYYLIRFFFSFLQKLWSLFCQRVKLVLNHMHTENICNKPREDQRLNE